MSEIKIGNRLIGDNYKPYFIADIGANHDGDIYRAYKLIELAKESGADAAKFQNFKANTIVSKNGFESIGKSLSHQASWKKSVYEVYKDASISEDWTYKLKNKCDEVGIEYMTSPYDYKSVDLVEPYVNAFKIGSGDITWTDIIEYICKKGKPVIIASGASTLDDVKRAMDIIIKLNNQVVLMQCNTNYTANSENYKYINLNVLKAYKNLYPDVILGLSDHTFGDVTVLGAISLGARVIEKHFTDDNSRQGPDHKFAMNPTTWKDMIERSNELWNSLGDGIKKIEENEKESAIVQRRALYFTRNIKAGEIIKEDDLIALRPIKSDGIPPYDIDKIVGKILVKDVNRDAYIKWEDFK